MSGILTKCFFSYQSVPQISLQLRPMLPRKQLDIPRFSPTAAWRLLSALESAPSEDDDLLPPESPLPPPLAPDKSGDSGISGDASPHHQDSTHNSQVRSKSDSLSLPFVSGVENTSTF